ncbi:hypothetical protein SAMN04490190_4063 [Pseudomonas libanensis]|uniref:Uncharacterized protein n=1 Tax=Pseudomonas libanensis TaxID=75588 RepID=A0A0R2YGD9_9PSED|nr:hypothetical protein [Pseudomonas libanensis]KRP47414.1 hypothetical protein TU73_06465 [Pseudomonas libanensis]SDL23670.1 hypothetical protein SAMN04490190_4063 [Pseudomonas libanensis]
MTSPASNSTHTNAKRLDERAALFTQLYVGPSFRETASHLLRQSLREQYPALEIDPDIAMVGTPTWQLIGDEIVAGPTHYQALSEILAIQAVVAEPALYIEGEHFLTQQPIVEPALHLPVRICELAKTLNLLAPVMLRAFQQQLVAYWNQTNGNGPHWHELSSKLRAVWNVETADDWSATECAMARTLFAHPDKADRKGKDPYSLKACLIEIGRVDPEQVVHHNEVVIAVLRGEHEGRTSILMHSLLKGYEKFPSLEQLGHSLPAHVPAASSKQEIQWRLYEPDGDFFDQQACAIVSVLVEAVGDIDFSDLRKTRNTDVALGTPPAVVPLATDKSPDLMWYQNRLPDWLMNASNADQNFFARHLKDLAALHNQNAGRSYLDDIPAIEAYALKMTKAQMLKEHPDSANVPLDKIRLEVRSSVIWGAFVVPGQFDTSTFSVAELALQNLIALPTGNRSLKTQNGFNLPEWLDADYFVSMVTAADIGSTYPALIKEKLLDDPQESSRRQTLYSQHLRIQLPMQALQAKINRQEGIDERGYRYVAAVLQDETTDRRVDGQTIVLRRLAFRPLRRTDASLDEVANMYVIGPDDWAAGPCLLYRPLFTPSLMQFPSPANLLYTISQSSSLRESVLAWLPDAVRNDYANYVFPGALPSPWQVADYLVEPDKLWTMSGPMALGEQILSGDRLATLFEANANALIELADRQSVSNAESRWATFKHAGWLIFNLVLPFVGRSAGTAAWIWQVVDQLQNFVEAQEHGDKQAEWSALTDVLLNLGMAITLHVASRSHRPGYPRKARPTLAKVTPAKEVTVKQLLPLGEALPTKHSPHLHISGAIKRAPGELGVLLDSFKVSKPKDLGAAETAQGQYQHLYHQAQKYYAPVGDRWFEVSADEDETVIIIDPKTPERTGPALIHNAQGQWFIDTRLRLRGGGPKRQQQRSKSEAEIKVAQAQRRLSQFENDKAAAQLEVQQARMAMDDPTASTSAETRRQTYLQKLQAQRNNYETALQQLKILNIFAPTANYREQAVRYVGAQLDLTETRIRETQVTFTPKLKTVLEQIEHQISHPQDRNIDDAQAMTTMSQDMIEHLNYVESRFTQLRAMGETGFKVIREHRKSLPVYTARHLRALQVTIARNLCVDSATTTQDAWNAIDHIVDNADLSIQTLHETLLERSESRLDERIETLGSLVEQFNILDERLQDFPQEFTDVALTSPLARLREKIRGFYNETVGHLELLHNDRETLRGRPTPAPTPPKPQKKVINTRYNGVLIGEPRLSATGNETGLVDIRSPLNQQVMATFHEKTAGVWVQHVSPVEAPPATAVDIATCVNQAQDLLDGLESFKQRADEQAAKPERSAIGIELLYHLHAQKLEQASANIEQALTAGNITDSRQASAAVVNKQLSDAAQGLYSEARRYKSLLIKKHPPTVQGLEWLLQNDEIVIKKTVKRRRLKSPESDYLDEYTISNRNDHSVLWYAHFHYSTDWVRAKSFLRARLKTPQEQARGAQADTLNGLSEKQKTAVYLSEINLEQARRLFFNVK